MMAIDQSGSSIMARRRHMALTAASATHAIEGNDGSNGHSGNQMPSGYGVTHMAATQMPPQGGKQMPSGYGAMHMAATQMPPRPLGNPGLTLRRNIGTACQSVVGVDDGTPNENDVKLAPLGSDGSTPMKQRGHSTNTSQTPQPIVIEAGFEEDGAEKPAAIRAPEISIRAPESLAKRRYMALAVAAEQNSQPFAVEDEDESTNASQVHGRIVIEARLKC